MKMNITAHGNGPGNTVSGTLITLAMIKQANGGNHWADSKEIGAKISRQP